MYTKLVSSFFNSEFLVLLLPDKLVVRQGGQGLSGALAPGRVQEFEYSAQSELEYYLSRVRNVFSPKPGDRWFLGLPLKYFTMANFTLPQAALDNLQQAVRYALMRHVPYDLEQAYIQYQQHKKQDLLEISAVVTPQEFIRPYLQPFASAGLTLYSVFPALMHWAQKMGDGVYVLQRGGYCEVLVFQKQKVKLQSWDQAGDENQGPDWIQARTLLENYQGLPTTLYVCQSEQGPEEVEAGLQLKFREKMSLDLGQGRQPSQKTAEPRGWAIDLLLASVRKKQRVMSYLVLGSFIFFLCTLLAWPVSNLVGQKRYLSKLETRIERLNSEAEELRQIRDENSRMLEQLQNLAELKNSYPSSLDILRELTEVIPESAWLYSLKYANGKITLQGEASSATRVIEGLENSSFFSEVGFSSPVTKSGNKERFTLEAKVEI